MRAVHLRMSGPFLFLPMRCLQQHTVPINYIAAERLDVYLVGVWSELPTRKSIQKALKRGGIRLADRPLSSAHRAKAGEVYELWVTEERPGVGDYDFRHEVVYEDNWLAILKKPAGWVVSGNQFRTVQNCLRLTLAPSPLPDALPWPRPVHRLDAPTSGLLLVAKTRSVQAALGAQFAARAIGKHYHAIACGYPPDEGGFRFELSDKPAHTTYTATERVRSLHNEWLSLVAVRLHTGRTHQIRKHFAAGGFPLFGDALYSRPAVTFRGKGLMLAATRLAFAHPVTGAAIDIRLPIPNKFDSLLKREARRWAKYHAEP